MGLYLLAVGGFALATPYGEAPDEYMHLRYIDYIVRWSDLPPIVAGAYSNEAVQPPLYYLLSATLVRAVRLVSGTPPHDHLIPPIHTNPAYPAHSLLVLQHPAGERWLSWPLTLRALAILCGLGVVLLTYATARLLVPPPAPALVSLLAAAVVAGIPQANFIRASVTNENLAALIGAWISYLLAAHLTGPRSTRRVGWLAVACGLGLLTKLSLAPLLPIVAGVLWLRRAAPPGADRRHAWHWAALTWVGVVAFYSYRALVYDDPLARAAWTAMLPSDSPWQWNDLFWLRDPFRHELWASFWGNFGWQRIPLPDWLYLAFAGLTLLAVLGGIALVARRGLSPPQTAVCAVCLATLAALYALVIVISLRLIAWQGRELYPALTAVGVLFGFGLAGGLLGPAATQPNRPVAGRRARLAALLLPAVALSLFAVNAYSILWLVWPLLNG